jgi:hypothetical protein
MTQSKKITMESLHSFKNMYSPMAYGLLKTGACEFKAGCLWTVDFVSEVLSKCFAWGISYQSIFKALFNIWWLTNLLALPGAAPFVPLALYSFCLDVVGFYSTSHQEILSCFSTICQEILNISGLIQQNQILLEQLQSMQEEINRMNLEITQFNQKCLEDKLVIGENQAKPLGLGNEDYLIYLLVFFNTLLFRYFFR